MTGIEVEVATTNYYSIGYSLLAPNVGATKLEYMYYENLNSKMKTTFN